MVHDTYQILRQMKRISILLDLAIPRLRAALPNAGILVLTIMDFSSYRQAALAAGADGFVPKATMCADLLPAIRHVVQSGQYRQKPAGDSFLGKTTVTGQVSHRSSHFRAEGLLGS